MRSPLFLLVLACCGGRSATTNPTPVEPGIAPRPFTAEQIRDAMPTGTDIRFRVEETGKPTLILHWHVIATDADTMTLTSQATTETGEVVREEGPVTSRWDELMRHATFPADRTTRTEGKVDVPAGSFETMDYVVTETKDGSTSVSTFRFARKLPGPPVELTVVKDGAVVQKMTLLSRVNSGSSTGTPPAPARPPPPGK